MYITVDATESEDAFMAAQIGALHERIHAVYTPPAAEHGAHFTSTVSAPYVYPVCYNAFSTELVFAELFNARFTPHDGGAQQLCIAQSEVGEESGLHTQVSSALAAMEDTAIGELLHQFGAGVHPSTNRSHGPWVHLLLYGGGNAAPLQAKGVTCAHVGMVSCCAVPPPPVDCRVGRGSQSELPPTLVWEVRFAQLPGGLSTTEAASQMARGAVDPIRFGVQDAVAASGRDQSVDRWCTNMAVMLQNTYVAKRGQGQGQGQAAC